MSDASVESLIDSLIHSPIDGFIDIFLRASIGSLSDSSIGPSIDLFIHSLVDSLIYLLNDCLTDSSTGHTHYNCPNQIPGLEKLDGCITQHFIPKIA